MLSQAAKGRQLGHRCCGSCTEKGYGIEATHGAAQSARWNADNIRENGKLENRRAAIQKQNDRLDAELAELKSSMDAAPGDVAKAGGGKKQNNNKRRKVCYGSSLHQSFIKSRA